MSEPLTSTTRKRLRINDASSSPSDSNNKREKARERQRKKRERDRIEAMVPVPLMHPDSFGDPALLDSQDPVNNPLPMPPPTPEEMSKKERVRQAARERQRKHRAVVKARRMAELGIQMIPPNPHVPLGYRLNENGQMEPVHDANAIAQDGAAGYGQTPGQTFARLLMTSAFLNPNLKQHMLRTLQMTADELAGFEPIIATAWDHWNHQRMHYHQQAARGPNDGHFGSGPGQEDVANGADMQGNEYDARYQHLPEGAMVEGVPMQPSNPIDPSLAVRETSALRNQSSDGRDEAHQEVENASG